MHRNFIFRLFLFLSLGIFLHAGVLFGAVRQFRHDQWSGEGSLGAVVTGASVSVHNPVSGYDRTTATDSAGSFSFSNIPLNPYHLSVDAKGIRNVRAGR